MSFFLFYIYSHTFYLFISNVHSLLNIGNVMGTLSGPSTLANLEKGVASPGSSVKPFPPPTPGLQKDTGLRCHALRTHSKS